MLKTVRKLFGRNKKLSSENGPANFVRPIKMDGKRKRQDRRVSVEPFAIERRKGERRLQNPLATPRETVAPEHIKETQDAVSSSELKTGTDGGRVVSMTLASRNVSGGDVFSDTSQTKPRVNLTAVAQASSSQSVSTKVSYPAALNHPTGQHRNVGSFPDAPEITRESQLLAVIGQPWRGMLYGVVHQELAHECIALDIRCGQVIIILTEAASRNSHIASVKKKIETDWSFKIVKTIVLPPKLILEVYNNIVIAMERGHTVQLTQSTSLLRVYDDIVEDAIKAGASDIHFQSYDGEGLLRLRIAGFLHHWHTLSEKLMLDCLSAAFGGRYVDGSSNHPSWGPELSIAFITKQTVNGSLWHGRYDGGKHSAGYYAAMRLLESTVRVQDIKTFKQLGYAESQLTQLSTALSRQWGLFLAIGGTGQGKSTLLRSVLVHLPGARNLSIQTIESPVEYKIPGALQYSVPVDVGLSSEDITQLFVGFLRNAMRRDPDVLMVGEIRDHETAVLSIAFAQTDKRSFSTIHAGGVVKALSRMTDQTLKIQPDTLGEGNLVNCLVYQRLLPKLCVSCKIRADHPTQGLSEAKRKLLLERFDLDPKLMFVERPEGCSSCRPTVHGLEITGTVGRVVAAEILMPTEAMLPLIAQKRWADVTRLWRDTRTTSFANADMTGKTAFEHGLFHVAIGDVSLRHLESTFESIESYNPQPIVKGGTP